MPPVSSGLPGKRYWRSLDELADTPEFQRFVENEFPHLAPELLTAPSRRQFLKVMAASLALAGLTGCRWPKETIVPFAKRPTGRTPGVPEQYATGFELNGVATGLLVTSYDGRPIKIEGNELHPFSLGATDAVMQASVLELYDPDRSAQPVRNVNGQRQPVDPEEFAAFANESFKALRARRGSGCHILCEASASPTLAEMRGRLLKALPLARWHEYEPLARDNEREGARLAFGQPYRPHLHLEKADVILSLDADFLMTHPAALRYTRAFARRRRADDGTMNRLYAVESNLTVTGSLADHRYPVRPSTVALVARRLAGELLKQGLRLLDAAQDFAARLGNAAAAPRELAFVEALAADLLAHKQRSVIVVGAQQPAVVHALAHVLNHGLGNAGNTVTYTEEPDADRSPHLDAITTLAKWLEADNVDALLILGGNPAFDAPADAEFGQHLASIKTSIHLSLYDNETSRLCTWHVPRAHYLESWGDARAYDGTVNIVQPLIEPLYGGKTPIELLALVSADELTNGYDLVRRTFRAQFAASGDFEQAWRTALHDGVVPDTRWPEQPAPELTPSGLESVLAQPPSVAGSSLEIAFAADYKVYDGRFANNGWLQELPDPLTKLTWDNAALVGPASAAQHGIKTGDVVAIEASGRRLEIAAYVLPGHAEGVITLPLGYGRRAAGRVAHGAGFDSYALRTSQEPHHVISGVTVKPTGRTYPLSTTQDHHAIWSKVGEEEQARRVEHELVREATLGEYKQHPNFAQRAGHALPVVPSPHGPENQSLWKEHEYAGHKWAMAIDLSACTGCGACVVACQAENNIPVVGKEEVARGREMHWIRVDRYFKGDPEQPAEIAVAHQPVTCHHCENAPCEQVCPVAATVHDAEGLNVMVYNRCIGTRYCNNNCPFKVRRFNWFYNHHGPRHPRQSAKLTKIEQMVFNPEVTVRSRGVMEKCTFCVQRINTVKIWAKNEGRPIADGLITPACVQACPAEAIVFGDLNDPRSRVARLSEHERSYSLLTDLHLKPRTHYLARLRNPATDGGPHQAETPSGQKSTGHSS